MIGEDCRVREIGEFALIAELHAALPDAARGEGIVELGIGDDAAVWRPAADTPCVATTDSLVEDIHFRLDWTDWRSLGHKVLAVNLSDCAAMGARPVLAIVALGLTGEERVVKLREMYGGMGELAAAHRVAVAGGDVVFSPRALSITVTVIGECADGPSLRRDGAGPGDIMAVSGTLGASAAGMRLLAEGTAHAAATTADILIAAHLRPQPRVALGRVLAAHGATAAMDLSDGLYGDLLKLLRASGVAGRIDTRLLPVAAAVRAHFPRDWLDLATRGGEDYELLFTVPENRWPEVRRAAGEVGATVSAIGAVAAAGTDEPVGSLSATEPNGEIRLVKADAFDHFA